MNKILLASLLGISAASAQSTWTGVINTNRGDINYSVNTVTDTMTITGLTGDLSTAYGPAQTTTLLALTDTGANSSTYYNPSAPTFDVTDAHFSTGAASGLGSVVNDGWFWGSTTSDSYFHLVIGSHNPGLLQPMNDSSAGSFSTKPNESVTLIIKSYSTPVATPEPSSVALLGLGVLGLSFRRKR